MQRSYVFANAQRGISLVGLIFVLAILGAVFILGMRIVPAYAEYSAIKDAIKIAKATNGTPQEMRTSFDKNADINNIESINSRDLVISKETGETEISFAYEKRIPLVANASLVIDYAGTTSKAGVAPAPKAGQ